MKEQERSSSCSRGVLLALHEGFPRLRHASVTPMVTLGLPHGRVDCGALRHAAHIANVAWRAFCTFEAVSGDLMQESAVGALEAVAARVLLAEHGGQRRLPAQVRRQHVALHHQPRHLHAKSPQQLLDMRAASRSASSCLCH